MWVIPKTHLLFVIEELLSSILEESYHMNIFVLLELVPYHKVKANIQQIQKNIRTIRIALYSLTDILFEVIYMEEEFEAKVKPILDNIEQNDKGNLRPPQQKLACGINNGWFYVKTV